MNANNGEDELPLTRQWLEDFKRRGTDPEPAAAEAVATAGSFEQWLKDNPAPDLQALVARHGGYDKAMPQAWEEFDRAMVEWQQQPSDAQDEAGG